jgi:hypothetical protein
MNIFKTKESLNNETLQLIREEVMASYEKGELGETFQDFWAKVETQNAYEEEWSPNKEKYKPFYLVTFINLKKEGF